MEQASSAPDTAPAKANDSLDRMLSLSEVCKIEGVSRWTIRRRVKDGKFPPGYELENGGVGWRESVIRARRENRVRRTYGAEAEAPTPEAA